MRPSRRARYCCNPLFLPLPPHSDPRAAWFEQTIVLDDLGTLLQPPYAHENIELGKDKSDTYRDYLRRRLESSRALALAS